MTNRGSCGKGGCRRRHCKASRGHCVQQITGATLLGVFASGDVSGVIVADKGTRRRLVEVNFFRGGSSHGCRPRGCFYSGCEDGEAGYAGAELVDQLHRLSEVPAQLGWAVKSDPMPTRKLIKTKLTFVPSLKRCINPKRGPLKPAQMQRLLKVSLRSRRWCRR